jgi:hypothetical protein
MKKEWTDVGRNNRKKEREYERSREEGRIRRKKNE